MRHPYFYCFRWGHTEEASILLLLLVGTHRRGIQTSTVLGGDTYMRHPDFYCSRWGHTEEASSFLLF